MEKHHRHALSALLLVFWKNWRHMADLHANNRKTVICLLANLQPSITHCLVSSPSRKVISLLQKKRGFIGMCYLWAQTHLVVLWRFPVCGLHRCCRRVMANISAVVTCDTGSRFYSALPPWYTLVLSVELQQVSGFGACAELRNKEQTCFIQYNPENNEKMESVRRWSFCI